MKNEIERIQEAVNKSGHYATIDRCGDRYVVATSYGWISDIDELNKWMDKVIFRFPFKAHKLPPNVQIEGLRAFAQSLSNAGLGVYVSIDTLRGLPCSK